VYSLVCKGSKIYAGGYFNRIGGSARNYIAALDSATGIATGWNPKASGEVITLAVNGNEVFAGGYFDSIGDLERNFLASIHTETGIANDWNPQPNSIVKSIVVNGSAIYVGGFFQRIGSTDRNYIAAIDRITGEPTTWNPQANSRVYALALQDQTLFTGGEFTTIGGQARNFIAALDLVNGTPTSWNPNAGSVVQTFAFGADNIYVGGYFDVIGGQPRTHLAALNTSNGEAICWKPNPNAEVHTIFLNNNQLFTGGNFTGLNGKDQYYFAVLPVPEKPIISNSESGDFELCEGETIVLQATDGMAYKWYKDGVEILNETSSSFTTGQAGIYKVLVTITLDCPPLESDPISLVVHPLPSTPVITENGMLEFCEGGSVELISSAVSGNQWYKDDVLLSGKTGQNLMASTGGVYTVKTTNNFNCVASSSNSKTLVVHPLPQTPVITADGSLEFCQGASIQLSSNAPSGNQWYRNGTAITEETSTNLIVTTSGVYSVKTTNSFNCTSSVSNTLSVVVNAIPTKPIIVQDGQQLRSSNVSGNQWYLNGEMIPGATGQIYTPTESGLYTVKTTLSSCESELSDSYNFIFTSISQLYQNEYLRIAPNPIHNSIQVSFNLMGGDQKLNISIYSYEGKLMQIHQYVMSNQVLSVKELPAGVYWVRMETSSGKRRFVQKVIKAD
jgi:hypothetical protein